MSDIGTNDTELERASGVDAVGGGAVAGAGPAANVEVESDTVYNFKVLAEVKKHPNIYNPDCKEYYDGNLKENSWVIIAEQIGLDEEICKKKWRNLRDQFMKKRKKLKTASRQAATRLMSWKYMDAIDFLFPYATERKRQNEEKAAMKGLQSQQWLKEDVSRDGEEEEEEEGDWEEASISPSGNHQFRLILPKTSAVTQHTSAPSSATPPGNRTSKRKRQCKEDSYEEKAVVPHRQNPDASMCVGEDFDATAHGQAHQENGVANAASSAESFMYTAKDEDECFMLSCVSTLRNLSPYRKMELRCKIQQLLLEYTHG